MDDKTLEDIVLLKENIDNALELVTKLRSQIVGLHKTLTTIMEHIDLSNGQTITYPAMLDQDELHKAITDTLRIASIHKQVNNVNPVYGPIKTIEELPAFITLEDLYSLHWVETIARVLDLKRLPDNWNSYNAPKIPQECLIATLTLLHGIMQEHIPLPIVMPSPLPGVQLEWHQDDIDLEVEIISLEKVIYFYDNTPRNESTEVEWEGTLPQAMVEIRRLFISIWPLDN